MLDIYQERGIVERVRQLAPYFQERLLAFSEHPLVGEARGAGLVGALELNRDKASKAVFEPTQGVAMYAAQRALQYGVITRGLGDTVNFCPPLIIEPEQIDTMMDGMRKALDDTYVWARAEGFLT